jgi:hypothetical protein
VLPRVLLSRTLPVGGTRASQLTDRPKKTHARAQLSSRCGAVVPAAPPGRARFVVVPVRGDEEKGQTSCAARAPTRGAPARGFLPSFPVCAGPAACPPRFGGFRLGGAWSVSFREITWPGRAAHARTHGCLVRRLFFFLLLLWRSMRSLSLLQSGMGNTCSRTVPGRASLGLCLWEYVSFSQLAWNLEEDM